MKVSAGQIDAFIAAGAKDAEGALIYGPDSGLVRARADALSKKIVDDPSDPFNVSHLSADTILDDPAALTDDLCSMSLGGGRRLIVVSDATDRLTNAIQSAMESENKSGFLIVRAGELTTRSSLRKFAEGAKTLACLPCYLDDGRALGKIIDDALREHKISCDSAGRAFLEQSLGNDRGITISELDKLTTYAGTGGSLSVDDIIAVIGDNAATTLSDIAFGAGDGDAALIDRCYNRCLSEGIPASRVIRAVAEHLMRLQLTESRLRRGESLDQAVKSLRPPLFFKEADRFKRQLSRWQGSQIAKGLGLLLEAERACRRTGAHETAICGRTLHQIAALGRQRGRRRGA